MTAIRLRVVALACGCGLALPACGSTSPSGSGSNFPSSVTGVISGATGLGSTPTTGTVQSGTPPGPTSGGGGASASSGTTATGGGGNEVTVSGGGAPFNTVFVSAGTSSGAATSALGGGRTRAETLASGFYEINLPAAVSSVAIGLTYASPLPSTGFDLLIQVANGSSSVSTSTTVHKTVSPTAVVELTGIVFAETGRTTPIDPLPSAVVSTSLDSHTATTDTTGAFDLQTATPTSNASVSCYTVTITFPGIAPYSVTGQWGSFPSNQVFVMIPPTPKSITPCAAR